MNQRFLVDGFLREEPLTAFAVFFYLAVSLNQRKVK